MLLDKASSSILGHELLAELENMIGTNPDTEVLSIVAAGYAAVGEIKKAGALLE